MTVEKRCNCIFMTWSLPPFAQFNPCLTSRVLSGGVGTPHQANCDITIQCLLRVAPIFLQKSILRFVPVIRRNCSVLLAGTLRLSAFSDRPALPKKRVARGSETRCCKVVCTPCGNRATDTLSSDLRAKTRWISIGKRSRLPVNFWRVPNRVFIKIC